MSTRWRVYDDGEQLLILSKDDAEVLIATVETDNCDDRRVAVADARVLAAAPILLEALRDLLLMDKDGYTQQDMLRRVKDALHEALLETM